MDASNASSSSGPVNGSDVLVWRPIDYSIMTHWPLLFEAHHTLSLESPFNDTVPSGFYPHGNMSHDAHSIWGGSIEGGNVGGPRACSRIHFKMLRPEPPDEGPIEVRRENQVVLGISITQEAELLWTYIKLPGVATEEHFEVPRKRDTLALVLEVHGATTGTAFVSACQKCSTKVSSAPLGSSLFDFASKGGVVGITGGIARVAFRFRCMPYHHGTTDREYRLTVTILDGDQTLARHEFNNCLRIVHHLRRRKDIPIVVLSGDSVTSVDSGKCRDAPPNAHTSDGSSSGTSAGESQCSVPTQPSFTPAPSPSARASAPVPRTDKESEPEREESGLPAFTARNDKCINLKHPLLSHMNPRRGSTNGGEEIYLISRIADGVLSCVLPAAKCPGVVDVTLCQENEDGYGKSLVSFEYQCDTSGALLASWLNAKHGSREVGTGITSA